MKKFLLITILLFSFIQISAQDEGDWVAKFNQMNKEFAKMMMEQDHEGMLKYYADDVISMPSYQPMIRGIEEMKKAQEMDKQSGVKWLDFTLNTTDVLPAGDYLIEIGTYTLKMEIPQMDKPYTDNGKYINVWEKQDDGSLKIKVDTWNSDINPYMMMQGMHEKGGEGKHEKMEMKKEAK